MAAMVCPQCHKHFSPEVELCPACHASLFYSGQSEEELEQKAKQNGWQRGPWGRMLVGLILVQGLSFGCQHLWSAVLAGQEVSTAREFWLSDDGLIWLHVIAAVGLLIGGALSGAGQDHGASHGAMLGLMNGVVFMLLTRHTQDLLPAWANYSQPFLHMIFGTIGGLLGQRIWKPVPKLSMLQQAGKGPRFRSKSTLLRGPIQYVRVAIGTAVATFGILAASQILKGVIDNSQGLFKIESFQHSRVLTVFVAAMFILFGGIVAGSSAFNGFKQGLCLGIFTAAIFLGVRWSDPKIQPEILLAAAVGILLMSLVSTWFGSRLLPPLYDGPFRRRGYLD